MNYQFLYGVENRYVDITQKVMKLCLIDGKVYIPETDDGRANLFGDPIYGTLKHIKIINNSTNDIILCNNRDKKIIDDIIFIGYNSGNLKDKRKVWWDVTGKHIEDPEIRLYQLHQFIHIDFGSFKEEYPEQLLAMKYIKETDTVLEIGANIGRNTCIIASILSDDKRLVTLECSETSARALEHNRNINGFHFNIVNAALSKQPLIQKGWDCFVSKTVPPGYTKVNTITWEELKQLHPLQFNVIVADCEGSMLQILKDEPDMLDNIETIIIENDYHVIEHKREMDEIITSKGFKSIYTESGGWGPCYPFFYQVFGR